MPRHKSDVKDVGLAITLLETAYQTTDRRLSRLEQKAIRMAVESIFKIHYDPDNRESREWRDAIARKMLQDMDQKLEGRKEKIES